MKRIAILQYDWPIQIHTTNFARSLAAGGYEVDLVIKKCPLHLVDMASLNTEPNIRIIDLDNRFWNKVPFLRVVIKKIRRIFEITVQRLAFTPLLWPVLLSAQWLIWSRKYDCLIGVEKKGMIWAGMISRSTGIPYLYYSLELYDERHPLFFKRPGFPELRKAEAFYHRRAHATIVQDCARGDYLLESNGIRSAHMIFFPVSVTGDSITSRGNYFENRFGIKPDPPIVLYLGMMDEPRHCVKVARLAPANIDRFRLIFHGYGEEHILSKIRSSAGTSIILSTDLVPEDQLPYVVASAHIGLAIYRSDCANDHLTAFSSEKVALYCRTGIPFIAFDTESYRLLKSRFDCCALVKDVAEIPDAVQALLGDYARYRQNAFRAFAACYQYEKNSAGVISQISELLTTIERADSAGSIGSRSLNE